MDDKLESIAYIEFRQTLIAMPVARSKFALHKYLLYLLQKEGCMVIACDEHSFPRVLSVNFLAKLTMKAVRLILSKLLACSFCMSFSVYIDEL